MTDAAKQDDLVTMLQIKYRIALRRIQILEEDLKVYKHRCLEAVKRNDDLATQIGTMRAQKRGKE